MFDPTVFESNESSQTSRHPLATQNAKQIQSLMMLPSTDEEKSKAPLLRLWSVETSTGITILTVVHFKTCRSGEQCFGSSSLRQSRECHSWPKRTDCLHECARDPKQGHPSFGACIKVLAGARNTASLPQTPNQKNLIHS
jgi:hypothetical protein